MLFIYILLGLIVLFFILLFLIYIKVFYPKRINNYDLPKGNHYDEKRDEMIDMIKALEAIPYEEVSIKSYDHHKLYAKLYLVSDSKEFALCAHGYMGSGVRDFSGGARLLMKLNRNILLIDERAQGKSRGFGETFGIKEREDIKSWVDYLNNRFGDITISLFGVSMGASTVLYASSMDLKNVDKIIADSPYNSPSDIIKNTIKNNMKLPVNFAYSLVYLSALIYGHFRLDKYNAMNEVKKSKYKILVVHGLDDDIVPPKMSEGLEKINPNVSREVFPNGGHVLSFMSDPERYKKMAYEFMGVKYNGESIRE